MVQDLARRGLPVVAACWFSGRGENGARIVTAPIPCPEAPPIPAMTNAESGRTAVEIVDALVQATRHGTQPADHAAQFNVPS